MVPGASSSQRILVTNPPATTILLVDDNDNDRTYYADRLKFSLPDCVVLEARDGRSGLQLYKSRHIDCIITELSLPDMSGFEVLLTVVQRPSQPAIAVVILTRAALSPLTDIALCNGAQAFLVKPYSRAERAMLHGYAESLVCQGERDQRSRRLIRVTHAPITH